jgi:hypothetical protein
MLACDMGKKQTAANLETEAEHNGAPELVDQNAAAADADDDDDDDDDEEEDPLPEGIDLAALARGMMRLERRLRILERRAEPQ